MLIQRHQPHPPGSFAPCCTCGREPHHVVSAAGTGQATTTVVHRLECARCHYTTPRFATLGQAAGDWTAVFARADAPATLPRSA